MPVRFKDSSIADIFDGYSDDFRDKLLRLREVIFEIADETYGVGKLEESLKWGQPSYVVPKSGSPIRLGVTKDGSVAIYTHCQTTLMSDFKSIFSDDFKYDGNRAIHLDPDQELPVDQLSMLIKTALTYHLN